MQPKMSFWKEGRKGFHTHDFNLEFFSFSCLIPKLGIHLAVFYSCQYTSSFKFIPQYFTAQSLFHCSVYVNAKLLKLLQQCSMFEVRQIMTPTLFFLLKITKTTYLGILWFHMYFRINFCSVNNDTGTWVFNLLIYIEANKTK